MRELELQNEVLHSALQELSAKRADLLRDQETETIQEEPRRVLVNQETSPHPLNLNRHDLLRLS